MVDDWDYTILYLGIITELLMNDGYTVIPPPENDYDRP
jgi:hypothetical protein